jgi:uroporphyrinogen decarboxylase
MTDRDNLLKAIRFETPDYIPMLFHINSACWNHYDQEALKDLIEAHPFLFPGYERPKGRVTPIWFDLARKDRPHTDPWGCVWTTTDNGITGCVHQHPLSSWDSFVDYAPPDPARSTGLSPIDWDEAKKSVSETRKNGGVVTGGLPHGHTFLRLLNIRGYDNLLVDMMNEDPRLVRLIAMIADFNAEVVRRWIALEPDILSYPEDLGMQVGPMISPCLFRQHIKPIYQSLMQPARDRGIIVHMHSDGDIRLLVDDLIDGGVEVINLQDLVNGIDWIAARFAGRICVDLDIDRQDITARGAPRDIDALIRGEVEKIGSKQGGLTMVYGLYPGVPLQNAGAVMDAMEKYATYYS